MSLPFFNQEAVEEFVNDIGSGRQSLYPRFTDYPNQVLAVFGHIFYWVFHGCSKVPSFNGAGGLVGLEFGKGTLFLGCPLYLW